MSNPPFSGTPPLPAPATKPVEFLIQDMITAHANVRAILSRDSMLFKQATNAALSCNRVLTYDVFCKLSVADLFALFEASFAMVISKLVVDRPEMPKLVSECEPVTPENPS